MMDEPGQTAAQPAPHAAYLPTHRPVVTYVLLGAIGAVFVLELILRVFAGSDLLFNLGAQQNALVNAGQYWRLFTAMFLHGGLAHLAFNGIALYSIGLDQERYLGSLRFLLIYILSGLAGGVLYFALGPQRIPSVGASGAIFGIIGAELAFVLVNRNLFGTLGRQRLKSILMLLAINVVINLAIPNLNKLAHAGGFICGLALGLALVPRYAVTWDPSTVPPQMVIQDRSSRVVVAAAVVVTVIVLVFGLQTR